MTTLPELIGLVGVVFERTGAAFPAWADPHPDRSPSEDEYSRVTDPGKWRIVGARADAWIDALVATGTATVHPDVTVRWAQPVSTVVTRATQAVPQVGGGLPLVVARSRIESVDDAGVTLAVGDPAVGVAWIPDCGCDACDSGSQHALDELDEYMTAIVTGQYRRLDRGRRSITVMPDRRQSSNVTGRAIDAVLADPEGWHELDGPSWLSPR